MANMIEYNDLIAFHPGYYVQDIIEEMGVSVNEFADKLCIESEEVSLLVDGRIDMSEKLANSLSEAIGTGPEIWLNLQNSFDRKIIEINNAKRNEQHQ